MNSLFGILGTIAGFIQFGITFFVLLELKGLIYFRTFYLPCIRYFPDLGILFMGYFNPILFGAFLTLVVGGMVEASSRD